MLKKGYLASNSIYVCIDHTDEILDKYFSQLDEIFKIIKKCEESLMLIHCLMVKYVMADSLDLIDK